LPEPAPPDSGSARSGGRICRTGGPCADIDPSHHRIFRLPEGGQQRAIFLVDPVAQKAGRHHDGDLVAIEPVQDGLTQPVAVFDLADLILQPRPHAAPLQGQSSIGRAIVRRFAHPVAAAHLRR
jgi:hypothetical protein